MVRDLGSDSSSRAPIPRNFLSLARTFIFVILDFSFTGIRRWKWVEKLALSLGIGEVLTGLEPLSNGPALRLGRTRGQVVDIVVVRDPDLEFEGRLALELRASRSGARSRVAEVPAQ